ncbi:MAG: polysaccharide biosynthesis protein, partial [Bacilli bacterium]
LRPGEKLYEELLIDHENVEKTDHERILKSFEQFHSYLEIEKIFKGWDAEYKRISKISNLFNCLKKYVEGY